MEILDLILEYAPIALSILATIKAFLTSRRVLSPEEIEQKAELKKQNYARKLYKKNKVKPIEAQSVSQSVETDLQTIGEISKNI